MNNTVAKTTVFKTWKTKTVATVIAVIAAVALPQAFHGLGAVSGLGTKLGEAFLPMHLAIIMVGLLAGSWAGLAAGLASPVISHLLSGMPPKIMLPFIIIELAAYGFMAGLLSKTSIHTFFKLLIVLIFGRVMRSVAVLIIFYGFNKGIPASTIVDSVLTGLPGIVLQLVLIPLIMFWIEKKTARK